MERPKKRELEKDSIYLQYDKGYNHCHSEFDRWLPDEDEIAEIIDDAQGCFEQDCNWQKIIAKAIHKRLGGDE